MRVEAQTIAREAEVADRRLQTIAAERQAWGERKDSASAQIATIAQRAEEARSERTELANAPDKFAGQRQALIGEIETATTERRGAADRLAQAEAELAEADKAARAALEAVGEARAEAARAEERCQGASRRRGDIEHEIRETLDVEPAGAAELAELKPGASPPQIAEVEATLDRIRRERERLGSVNLLAEQELREVEAQHDRLASERDDLVEAIRRLRQGIHSLNHEARERLLASFAVVNDKFQGSCSPNCSAAAMLESAASIERARGPARSLRPRIMASRPARSTATLSLLSGGEHALTALAPIFAVFLTNPAPIWRASTRSSAPLDETATNVDASATCSTR